MRTIACPSSTVTDRTFRSACGIMNRPRPTNSTIRSRNRRGVVVGRDGNLVELVILLTATPGEAGEFQSRSNVAGHRAQRFWSASIGLGRQTFEALPLRDVIEESARQNQRLGHRRDVI